MQRLTPSFALEKLADKSAVNKEALDLCARQAAMAVDELINGGWHPFLVQMIFAQSFFMTMHMARIPPSQVRDLVRELFPHISEAMRAHIEQWGGLGPLLEEEASSEIVVPPRFGH